MDAFKFFKQFGITFKEVIYEYETIKVFLNTDLHSIPFLKSKIRNINNNYSIFYDNLFLRIYQSERYFDKEAINKLKKIFKVLVIVKNQKICYECNNLEYLNNICKFKNEENILTYNMIFYNLLSYFENNLKFNVLSITKINLIEEPINHSLELIKNIDNNIIGYIRNKDLSTLDSNIENINLIRDYRKICILEIKKFDEILKNNKYIIEIYNRRFIDYEYINKFPYFINKTFKNYCYLFLKN